MSELHFDLCIIGAGPAGYAAAMRAWDFGKQVALVEKGHLGGTGVYNGALSSKTFWELSRYYRSAIAKDRGYVAERLLLDFNQVAKAVKAAVEEKSLQLEKQLEELSSPGPFSEGAITFFHGAASFLGPHELHIEGGDAGETRNITADHFIIATGSAPRTLPNVEIDGIRIVTSDHLTSITHFPKSMVIIGAGVVGCEFATIFANYGLTKVYLIDRADRILPFEDEDLSRICATNLESRGVTIHHRAQLIELKTVGEMVHYTIEHPTGARETISVELALISIGRVPTTGPLQLNKAGVACTAQGYVDADECRTNVPHIYAVGDITSDLALVSVAEIEGRHAVELMYATPNRTLRYDNLSTIMFLDPEVAAIGLNELQAQEQRIPYRVATYGYSLINRAIAMRETGGFVKMLVTDDEHTRLLGMRVVGEHASTTIQAAALIIDQGMSIKVLSELLHPHPAITEIMQECVRMLEGTSVYKPEVFRSDLRVSRVGYES